MTFASSSSLCCSKAILAFSCHPTSPTSPFPFSSRSQPIRSIGSHQRNSEVSQRRTTRLLFKKLIRLLPERCRASWSMLIIVLVEPISKHTTCRPNATDLNAFGPPPLLTMEDGESRPANFTFWGLPYSTFTRLKLASVLIHGSGFCLPRILELALGSQLACRLLLEPVKCTMGSRSPLKSLQSIPSSSSSSSAEPGGSTFVT